MKIIALTSNVDGKLLYINVDTIGHVYDVVKKVQYKEDDKFTKVGTTCHNNGGFEVMEDAKTILKMINDFVNSYGGSRFSPVNPVDDKIVHNRAGWWEETGFDDYHKRLYYFTSGGLDEATRGFDRKKVTDVLIDKGWLKKGKDRVTTQKRLDGRSIKVYVIDMS
jgi:hypothetical protein